jgi:type VI secretion system protein ImpH
MDPQLTHSVLEQLLTEGYRFSFFQAVRILEQADDGRVALGHELDPQQEIVRMQAHPSLDFPASEIYDVARGDERKAPRMTVTFFGMYGPQGALPQHYTERLIDRLLKKDTTLRAFLDLFNHRLLSLFYRAWEKYQFWVIGERSLRREREVRREGEERFRAFVLDERPLRDPLAQVLLDLTGLGSAATRYRLANRDRLECRTEISDQTWRFYAGLFAQRQRCSINLEQLLSDYFQLPFRFQPLCGRWLQLDEPDRTRLGSARNGQLGVDAIAGRKVWEVQGRFRLQIGPVGYEQFCSLLPIGSAHLPLAQLTRFYVGQQFDFDLELQLRSEEIPPLRCGDPAGVGPRLGWNTWLKSRKRDEPTASVCLRANERPRSA